MLLMNITDDIPYLLSVIFPTFAHKYNKSPFISYIFTFILHENLQYFYKYSF